MVKIVLASDNPGKLKEIKAFLADMDVQLLSQSEFHITSAPENGLSFIENALIKARHAAKFSNLPALADDSGLAVDALAGAPGIYSARYAGENAHDQDNIDWLLQAMLPFKGAQRKARFYCALAFVRHASDPVPLICQAYWEGEILTHPQGTGGFGYDPIFFVPELNCSAAELLPQQKNQLSHRAKALKAFVQELKLHYLQLLS